MDYPKFVLKGIPPFDGEYEWDFERPFNVREWRYIKKISGYLPATLDDGFTGDDPELYVALAVVCMVRAGKVERDDALRVAEQISEAPFDNARLVIQMPPKEDGTESPLGLTPPPDVPSQNETGSSQSSSDERASGSGKTSTRSSGQSDATPQPTGTIESDTPAVRPLRWVS